MLGPKDPIDPRKRREIGSDERDHVCDQRIASKRWPETTRGRGGSGWWGRGDHAFVKRSGSTGLSIQERKNKCICVSSSSSCRFTCFHIKAWEMQ